MVTAVLTIGGLTGLAAVAISHVLGSAAGRTPVDNRAAADPSTPWRRVEKQPVPLADAEPSATAGGAGDPGPPGAPVSVDGGFPWLLHYGGDNWRTGCTAVLIGPRAALTSASCGTSSVAYLGGPPGLRLTVVRHNVIADSNVQVLLLDRQVNAPPVPLVPDSPPPAGDMVTAIGTGCEPGVPCPTQPPPRLATGFVVGQNGSTDPCGGARGVGGGPVICLGFTSAPAALTASSLGGPALAATAWGWILVGIQQATSGSPAAGGAEPTGPPAPWFAAYSDVTRLGLEQYVSLR
ncbi:hypothetical protein ACFFX1_39205 [Dactylosporangium sucinum]|uniref:Peptidase S1 domain-containing protein n=1 Tax=Dactylosporangium sucinum TaxID=1424081 RepID=A0A917WFW1_9ACTN|nr:hypothetical protein [Dactylosporangium sucinum]GGM03577.1 hypothetical protein GCM10007977_001160 [Dactylosporangium sucinum]